VLDSKPSAERKYLYSLEQLHKSLVLYLWLSYRFPNVFTTRNLANYAKKLVEDAIEKTLSEFSFTQRKLDAIKKKREKAMKQIEQEESREMEGQSKGDKSGSAVAEMIQSDPSTDDVDEYPSPELDMDVGEEASAEQLEPEWRPSSRHIDVGVGRTEDLPQSRV
jgi:ATP-dependent RNA helicase SUPV3L1/SUV3